MSRHRIDDKIGDEFYSKTVPTPPSIKMDSNFCQSLLAHHIICMDVCHMMNYICEMAKGLIFWMDKI